MAVQDGIGIMHLLIVKQIIHKPTYIKTYKSSYEWLKEIDSHALCNVCLDLDKAFKIFFKKSKGFPKFKKKGITSDSYTTNNQNNKIRIENGKLRLPKLGFVNFVSSRFIKGIILRVTITMSRSGKFFASILTEQKEEIKKQNLDIEKTIGIDMSLQELAVMSDGTKAKYPKYYRKLEKKLAFMQKKLTKMEYGSNRYNSYRKKIARLYEYIANQRSDFLHKLSTKIVQEYDCICVEDINLQTMSKSKFNFGKSIYDIGFGEFRRQLEYKAERKGKVFIKADKWFPSSKLCSVCGFKNDKLKLKDRNWKCTNCGAEHDRDINAALNLKSYARNSVATDAVLGSNGQGEEKCSILEKYNLYELPKIATITTPCVTVDITVGYEVV